MYELLEYSLADTRRLFDYRQKCELTTDFGLKSFAYGWLSSVRQWQAGEKVLDVGSAYFPFPMHLHNTYGCETWVVDDFGTKFNEPYWLRGRIPADHIQKNKEVKYVLERVGNPDNLKEAHFLATPQTYMRLVLSSLPFSSSGKKELSRFYRTANVFQLVLNPEVLVESYEHGYYRITRDKLSHYTFERWGGLLIGLRKENDA